MRRSLKLLIFVLIISCGTKTVNKNQANTDSISINRNVSNIKSDTNKRAEQSDNPLDCTYDQLSQTDEFLKNIDELKNYKWDYDKRTATIVLNNGDTLLITRGGCYHFGVSAEFRLTHDKIDYNNWKNVYAKVLWIAKILDREFDYKDIKNELDSNKVIFKKYEVRDAVSFSSEYLQENNYEIIRELNNNHKVITLSHYY